MVGLHKVNITSLDASGICSASERLQIQRVVGMHLMRRKDKKMDVVFLWDSSNRGECCMFAL